MSMSMSMFPCARDLAVPADVTSISPTEGRCAVNGATARDVRTGEQVKVAGESQIVVRGCNFAPTPKLSCSF
eukprot:454638-Prymnesium_polylepis.1